MYRGTKWERRPTEDVKQDILRARELFGEDVRKIFIGDSDSLAIKPQHIVEIVSFLHETFPHLERVTSYARAKTLSKRTLEELKAIREAGLTRLHVGLETGDPELLEWIRKGPTPEEMVDAGRKVLEAGFELSEYVIPGLGGSAKWRQHALGTADVLNQINPNFIRLRTMMLLPGTKVYDAHKQGDFELNPPLGVLKETRLLIENLDVSDCQVLSDHVSNYLQVDGVMPQDKEDMLQLLDITIGTIEAAPEAADKILQPEYLRRP